MSYIPDYRSKENEKHLNEADREFLAGYRCAIDNILTLFDNLDVYDVTEKEEEVISQFKECVEDWVDTKEKEMVCSLFDNADYIPEDVDIVDMNRVKKNG